MSHDFYMSVPLQRLWTGDAELAVRVYGKGRPLLLLHGWPLDGYTWRNLLPALSKQFKCVVLDQAGLGDSSWTETTAFSFDAHARRAAAAMQKLGLNRYAILAQDTGATVARYVAATHATSVDRLCLMNTEMAGHRPPWIPLYQKLFDVPGAKHAFGWLLRSSSFRRSQFAFGGCFHDRRLIDGPFGDRYGKALAHDPRKIAGVIRYLQGIDWMAVDATRQLHRFIRVPIQFVWGAQDVTFPINIARSMLEQFSNPPRLVAIQGACLLPHEEKPAEVLAAVLPFLLGREPRFFDPAEAPAPQRLVDATSVGAAASFR